MSMSVCLCVCEYVSMFRLADTLRCHPQDGCLRISHCSEAYPLGQTGWHGRILLALPSQCWNYKRTIMTNIFTWIWGFGSGPKGCKSSSMQTEPSSWPITSDSDFSLLLLGTRDIGGQVRTVIAHHYICLHKYLNVLRTVFFWTYMRKGNYENVLLMFKIVNWFNKTGSLKLFLFNYFELYFLYYPCIKL